MKYKLKFTGYSNSGLVPIFEENEIIDSSMLNGDGLIVFIPFTDTRFFEPIQSVTVQVEIPENMIEELKEWVKNVSGEVIDTKPEYYTVLMNYLFANNTEAYNCFNGEVSKVTRLREMYTISKTEHGSNRKLEVIKDICYYITKSTNIQARLKAAKDIVDAWW